MSLTRSSRLVILLASSLGGLVVVSVLVYAVLAAFKSPGEDFGFGSSW